MLYELGRFFLLSIHQKITKTLQGALFLSTDAENHRSNEGDRMTSKFKQNRGHAR